MPYNPDVHHRRSIRLQGYDYSQHGAYFITICTQNQACLFGEIVNGEMILNDAGQVTEECWQAIPDHFPQVELDAHVIMPNHVHGIMLIGDDGVGLDNFGVEIVGPKKPDAPETVGTIVGAKNISPLPPPQPCQERPRGTSQTIGSIVRGFKIGVTKWFRAHTDIYTVWQRNYYERIIRDENELNQIRKYIINNQINWEMDENYV